MRTPQAKPHPPSFTVMMPLGKPQGTNHGLQVFRHGKHAGIGLSSQVRGWKGAAHNLLSAACPEAVLLQQLFPKKPQPVGIGIVFLTKGVQPFRNDMDGSIKFAQDALARAWRFNDARVRGLVVMQTAFQQLAPTLDGATYFWLGPVGDLPNGDVLIAAAHDWFMHNSFVV